ncbi:MAG TPA: DmsC/YnfH family molybdoenzyme membrane anchor subunit [Nitratidesulfovibrio sp.]|nr:DmsC/YnfH family molybdoenzyme membrane anchor subunit [Nitratidesulfovibrio sp.]
MFHEWSLVLFTVLVQMAAGAMLLAPVAALACLSGASPGNTAGSGACPRARRISRGVALVAAPVMVASLLISLLHLGTPLNAPKTLLHLDTSWLSREILFTGLLALCAVLLAIAEGRGKGASPVLRWAGALAAAACLLSMTNVYMLRTVPAWNGPLTPLAFVAAALLLGAGVVAVAALWPQADAKGGEVSRIGMAAPALAALVTLAALVVHALALLAAMPGHAVPGGMGLATAHLVLLALGAGVLLAAALRARAADIPAALRLAGLALALALAGELAGRVLFFGLYARMGL